MLGINEITLLVKRAAQEAGFDLAGIAPARDFNELAYFPQWIADGHAGEMKYLEARDATGRLKRESLRIAAPWAESVIVCAINYNTAQPYSTQVNDRSRGWISRYAWGQADYHESVLRRLRQVEGRLVAALASEPPSPPASNGESGALRTWCYVDTGPVIERVYAKYAGVGWIGKNTCVLNQKLGSWLFLGVILTSLKLVADLPAPDRCGACTRCLDACPTNASSVPTSLTRTNASRISPLRSAAESPRNCATEWVDMYSDVTSAKMSARGTGKPRLARLLSFSHAKGSSIPHWTGSRK